VISDIGRTAVLAEIAEELVRVARSPITPTKKPYHCWRSLCRILSSTGNCSSNFHLDLKMKNAGQALSEEIVLV
jgi:hypothetical protein